MTYDFKNRLPEALLPFEKEFEKTILEYNAITISEEKPAEIWSSKVKGYPYLPQEMDYPTDENGTPLTFVAQIDFSEMPTLEGFPAKGMIQFFVGSDDLYGLNFDNPTEQKNFKLIYHEEILKDKALLNTDFSFLEAPQYAPFEDETSYGLSFEKLVEPISSTDVRFEKRITEGVLHKFGEKKWDLIDEYLKKNSAKGSKVGGYPHFTQEDPRADSHEVLLFQLDNDSSKGIHWGDAGVANFFINTEDLLKADFSNIWYNWDCY